MAFGDVITLEEQEYIGIIRYKDGAFSIVCKGLDLFLQFIDNHYITKHFDLSFYHEAVEKHGQLDYNQCFGFVPLLALGGSKDIDHLDKVKIIEHILLITQLAGNIGM